MEGTSPSDQNVGSETDEQQTTGTEDPAAREPGSEADEAAESATTGDQGPWEKGLQDAAPANAPGFDPDRPVRTSPPAPEEQSGVPNLPDERNAGVEPGETPANVEPGTPADEQVGAGDDSERTQETGGE